MREFKFRAWLPETNEMTYNLAFEEYEPIDQLLASVEHLMQFTGLTDVTGNKVYEYDLVRIEKAIYKVVWSGNAAKFILQIVSGQQGGRNFRMVRFGQVVGNIYENEGLLK